jgi:hypothetical protein
LVTHLNLLLITKASNEKERVLLFFPKKKKRERERERERERMKVYFCLDFLITNKVGIK